MNCLVTGGAGFIGSHLIDELIKLGHKIIIVDDFSLGKNENLSQHKGNKNLTIYRKSICDGLADIFKKNQISVVFHLAALPRVQFSINNPLETHDVNVNGTLNLLHASKTFGVKRFVFASSSSVYGNQKILPLKETMSPNPVSPYALHKLIGEHYCKIFNLLYDLETISLRYFNVFGPRQNTEGEYACLIPRFIKLISQNIKPTINGDGEQTRDFTFVSDVVRATILAASTENEECFGRVFNIGAGGGISVNEVARKLISLDGKNMEPIHGPHVIEPKDSLADISEAKKLLKWAPKTDFEEGLKRTYASFNLRCQNSQNY